MLMLVSQRAGGLSRVVRASGRAVSRVSGSGSGSSSGNAKFRSFAIYSRGNVLINHAQTGKLQALGVAGTQRRFFSDYPDHIELTMPALSPTMEKGNIATWLKKEGDRVEAGDVLAEVDTDKATVAFESVEEGWLAKILVQDGAQDVDVGVIVGILVEEEEDVAKFSKYTASASASAAAPASSPAPAAVSAPPAPAPSGSAGSAHMAPLSPAVNWLVMTEHIDATSIVATGPKGRLLKGDVLKAIRNGTAKKLAKSASVVVAPTPKVSAPQMETLPSEFTIFGSIAARRASLRTWKDVPLNKAREAYAARNQARFAI